MYARMQNFSEKELSHIHDASMDLLKNTGVAFNDDKALKTGLTGECVRFFQAATIRSDV